MIINIYISVSVREGERGRGLVVYCIPRFPHCFSCCFGANDRETASLPTKEKPLLGGRGRGKVSHPDGTDCSGFHDHSGPTVLGKAIYLFGYRPFPPQTDHSAHSPSSCRQSSCPRHLPALADLLCLGCFTQHCDPPLPSRALPKTPWVVPIAHLPLPPWGICRP